MNRLVRAVMDSLDYTKDEAEEAVNRAREELMDRLAVGDYPYDICEEHFGLEPDYLEDLIC